MFDDQARNNFITNSLLNNFFVSLFLHWSYGVRGIFHRILLYRLVAPDPATRPPKTELVTIVASPTEPDCSKEVGTVTLDTDPAGQVVKPNTVDITSVTHSPPSSDALGGAPPPAASGNPPKATTPPGSDKNPKDKEPAALDAPKGKKRKSFTVGRKTKIDKEELVKEFKGRPCRACQTSVPLNLTLCSGCGTTNPMPVCTACNFTQFLAEQNMCTNCGASLKAQALEKKGVSPKENARNKRDRGFVVCYNETFEPKWWRDGDVSGVKLPTEIIAEKRRAQLIHLRDEKIQALKDYLESLIPKEELKEPTPPTKEKRRKNKSESGSMLSADDKKSKKKLSKAQQGQPHQHVEVFDTDSTECSYTDEESVSKTENSRGKNSPHGARARKASESTSRRSSSAGLQPQEPPSALSAVAGGVGGGLPALTRPDGPEASVPAGAGDSGRSKMSKNSRNPSSKKRGVKVSSVSGKKEKDPQEAQSDSGDLVIKRDSEKSSDKGEKTSDKAADRASDKASRSSDKTADNKGDKDKGEATNGKPSDKAANRSSDKTAEKLSDKGKGEAKPNDKPFSFDKTTDKGSKSSDKDGKGEKTGGHVGGGGSQKHLKPIDEAVTVGGTPTTQSQQIQNTSSTKIEITAPVVPQPSPFPPPVVSPPMTPTTREMRKSNDRNEKIRIDSVVITTECVIYIADALASYAALVLEYWEWYDTKKDKSPYPKIEFRAAHLAADRGL